MLAMLPTVMVVAVTPVSVLPPLPPAGVWFPLAPQADVDAADVTPVLPAPWEVGLVVPVTLPGLVAEPGVVPPATVVVVVAEPEPLVPLARVWLPFPDAVPLLETPWAN